MRSSECTKLIPNKHNTSFHSAYDPSRVFPDQFLPSSVSATPDDSVRRPFPKHLLPGTATRNNPPKLPPFRHTQGGFPPFHPPSYRYGANDASCPDHCGSI